jgi:hypothetical protein
MLNAAAIVMCMIVTSHEVAPVELHGCVPAADWTTSGCDTSDDVAAPVVLTVKPGRNVFEDDDNYTLFARLWDDGPKVSVHWQEGGPCA